MNVHKFVLAFYAGVIIVIITFAAITQYAEAQSPSCGLPGLPPCPPPSGGGGGGKKQKPPPKLPTNTPTPTPNVFQTFTAETLTAEPTTNPLSKAPAPPAFDPADATATALEFTYLQCYATIFPPLYQTAAAALTQTSNDWSSQAEATADVAVNRCAYGTPPSPTPVFIPPVAGPQFLPPGVINIIGILIIIVCFGGLFLFLRSRFMGDGSVRADDLNPQPLPPKGMGNGSDQFDKHFPDGSNQFAKIEDGSDQFDKHFPNGASQFQKADDDQFIKLDDRFNDIEGNGSEQL
ncbi:MAG: hypothetical protein M1282_15575 [Chloroflexi bacterium]|nr:hypothetical protein [Chloroflexota bacterium]